MKFSVTRGPGRYESSLYIMSGNIAFSNKTLSKTYIWIISEGNLTYLHSAGKRVVTA